MIKEHDVYFAKAPIKTLVDKAGELYFSDEEVLELRRHYFFTLSDLFTIHTAAASRFDSRARAASKVLQDLNPQSNSVGYRLEEICNNWRETIEFQRQKQARLTNEASMTVPLTATAPVGRASRLARQFKKLTQDEVFDFLNVDGKRCECNLGAMGFSTSEDEYGYNG